MLVLNSDQISNLSFKAFNILTCSLTFILQYIHCGAARMMDPKHKSDIVSCVYPPPPITHFEMHIPGHTTLQAAWCDRILPSHPYLHLPSSPLCPLSPATPPSPYATRPLNLFRQVSSTNPSKMTTRLPC